jgi:arabinan endo-1,5-alpha-L-arabinosidase
MKQSFYIILFLLSGVVFSQESNYKNPIVDFNFPDPTVIKAADGYYYAYATNTRRNGKAVNIQVLKSENLVEWHQHGDAMPEQPNWASSDFWAPHVTYNKGNGSSYYMYYSGESNDESIGKCLGVAVSDSPLGPFVDKGEPLLCGDTFINIDPMVFQDENSGKNYLYWGSGHESIKVRELSSDLLNFRKGSVIKEIIHPVDNSKIENYERLIEGAWLTKRDNFFYLFYSGDNCCGENAHYAVMVARSESPEGPFEKYKNRKGTPVILSQNKDWLAPDHNSVITDEDQTDWIMYHAIDPQDIEKGRIFLMDKINYQNGWPVIEKGAPSKKLLPAPQTN